MDQRFLSGDRSGKTAADLKRTYRRGGSLGRRIQNPALGGDRKKTGARILSTLCLAEAMQSEEGYQKILADELYNVFLKFIQVSR